MAPAGSTGSRELQPSRTHAARVPGWRAWLARLWIPVSLCCTAATSTQTWADTTTGGTDGPSCQTVRLSDVGWTDVTATTATLTVLLRALGYESKVTVLSVPVTYTSMKNKDIDVFLGDWMPAQEGDIKPYLEDRSVEVVGMNLTGAKFTLAVPSYTLCTRPARLHRHTALRPAAEEFDLRHRARQ